MVIILLLLSFVIGLIFGLVTRPLALSKQVLACFAFLISLGGYYLSFFVIHVVFSGNSFGSYISLLVVPPILSQLFQVFVGLFGVLGFIVAYSQRR